MRKIHLTVEELPWDPNEYSQRETCMLDHQGQIIITAIATRGSVYVSAVISYSLTHAAADVMDNDDLVTAMSAQIQIRVVLIGMVRKPSLEPKVLSKRRSLSLRKLRRLYRPQCREGLGLFSTFHC